METKQRDLYSLEALLVKKRRKVKGKKVAWLSCKLETFTSPPSIFATFKEYEKQATSCYFVMELWNKAREPPGHAKNVRLLLVLVPCP